MAKISAQPILHLSLFQPGENFQALHSPLKTILMPHDEEASTQNLIRETGGGFVSVEPQKGDESCVLHQLISARTVVLGVLQINSDNK